MEILFLFIIFLRQNFLLMDIQINELLIEPKIWQLFYYFENDKHLVTEIFSSKIHTQVNNCFFLNGIEKNEESFYKNVEVVRE